MSGISIDSINTLLKIKYASEVAKDVNEKVGPWFEQIKGNGLSAGGKYYLQPIQLGINGGVGFSDEYALPEAATAIYDEFKVDTKNIYGVFNITKKALVTNNTPEKIVNYLTREMTSLVDSLKWNLSRSLEMQSSGILCTVTGTSSETVTVDTVQYVLPGMMVSFYASGALLGSARIKEVDKSLKKLVFDASVKDLISVGCKITIYNSFGKELTGLNDIFESSVIYNLERSKYSGLKPYIKNEVGEISDMVILDAINACEDNHNISIDYIRASNDVVSKYIAYKQKNNLNVASLDIKGGYKTISFNGSIPIVKSKFAPEGTMDLLDSKTFQMYNLGKGEFDSESGSILQRDSGKASYTGLYTLFTEQYCRCPGGQGRLTGITA